MSGRLADLTGPGVVEALSAESVVLLPVGAIEQHGPHLPLSVDTVIAEETASAVLETGGNEVDLWLLPTLSVSKSNEHAWSPGTLWLSAETMLRVLGDLAACVATTAARRLELLNGHGGNTSLLGSACRDIRVAHGLLTFLIHPSLPPASGGDSSEEELGMGVHGGLRDCIRSRRRRRSGSLRLERSPTAPKRLRQVSPAAPLSVPACVDRGLFSPARGGPRTTG